MVKKGQEQVSRMDSPRQGEDRNPDEMVVEIHRRSMLCSPRQGEDRNPDEGKVKHRPKPRGGDGDRNSAQSEGSSKGS